MRVISIVGLCSFVLALSACSSVSAPSKTASKLNFNSVAKISLGIANQQVVVDALGEPDQKIRIPNSTLEAWMFYIPATQQTKLSLIYDFPTGVLKRKVWIVDKNEPEDDLETAKSRFSSAKFESRQAKQTNPHYIPDETIFFDAKLGLALVYRRSVNEVESISWTSSDFRSIAGGF